MYHVQQTTYRVHLHTDVHRIRVRHTHTHTPTYVHVHPFILHSDTQQARCDGKRTAVIHTVASVIPAAEEEQITILPLPSFSWHAAKQITLEEPSGARTEIYLNWIRARSIVALSLMRKFTFSFPPVICRRETNDGEHNIWHNENHDQRIMFSNSQPALSSSPHKYSNFKGRLDMKGREILCTVHVITSSKECRLIDAVN